MWRFRGRPTVWPGKNTNERDGMRKTERQRKRKYGAYYIHIKGIPSILR